MSYNDPLLSLHLDYGQIGLEKREEESLYFCTPLGAEIIGWAGVDGIHYCTIPEFGEMIFAVSPMNVGDYVHPIARSLSDLFSLLLSCGDLGVLEQCYAWDREQFESFLRDNPMTEKQRNLLDQIQKKLKLKPIKDAYQYIKNLQNEFDYNAIPYSEDYYDEDMNPAAPLEEEWSVCFEGGFWSHRGDSGTEVPLNQSFRWGNETWNVLSAYLCEEGLVVDFGVEVDLESLRAFIKKWNLQEGEPSDRSKEEIEQMLSEQPMVIEFRSELCCNGRKLQSESGCSINWIPASCQLEESGHDKESRRVMHHYNLDTEKAWSIWRCAYRWKERKEKDLNAMELTLRRSPRRYACQMLVNPQEGMTAVVENPVSGEKYQLTVESISREIIDLHSFQRDSMEYPTHCLSMTYSMEPDPGNRVFTLQDRIESDQPRSGNPYHPDGMTAIIGGANSVTGIGQSDVKKVYSALHFDTEFAVEWVPAFWMKTMEDLHVKVK